MVSHGRVARINPYISTFTPLYSQDVARSRRARLEKASTKGDLAFHTSVVPHSHLCIYRPVPLVGSRLESRSAALGGSLGAATTTSTIKRRCDARSVFMFRVRGLFCCRVRVCVCVTC